MDESSEGTALKTSSEVFDSGENVYRDYFAGKVPPLMSNVPAHRLDSLISQSPSVPQWYDNARPMDRQYLKELTSERWRLQGPLEKMLGDLQQDIKAFAQPLLVEALKDQLNLELDVNKTLLRAYVSANFTFGIDTNASRVRQYTLLEAALHNFEESETQAGAFRDGSGIFIKDAEGGLQRQALTVERFASLCRTLDIGAQYQKHISALLKPETVDARSTLDRHFVACEKAAFNESALIAYLKNDITYASYSRLQDLRDRKSEIMLGNRPMQSHRLSLMGFKLTGIVLFSAVADPSQVKRTYDSLVPAHQRLLMQWSQRLSILPGQEFERFKLLQAFFANGPSGVTDELFRREDLNNQSRLDGTLIAYVPDDPEHPIKEYASFTDFMKELISQLRSPDYQQFFSRFVAHKDKGRFFIRVNERFSTFTWQQREPLDMGPWWRETATENPDAEPITNPVTGDLWQHIAVWRREKAIADARHIAIPTGDEDAATRWARLTSYLSIGWNIFNFGAMLVPGLGEAMLSIMVGQMMLETMEGIEDWSKGDKEEAASLLTGVLINFAQLAIMAAGHVLPAGAPAAVKPSAFINKLKMIESGDGKPRLWNPDLSPYEHNITLARNAKPNSRGLFSHGDQEFLLRDGKLFAVQDDPGTGQPRLRHPDRPTAYQPKLEHNGAGAWTTELDRPIEWGTNKLMRHLGAMVDAFDDATLEQIRIASGVDENVLRRLQVENEPPPALLTDTINRFKAWTQTGKLPENVQPRATDTGVLLLQDAFAQLPDNVAEELLARAEPADLRVLAEQKRIPPQLRQQARAALLEIRLARAYEGLFLEGLEGPDSERLALHTLPTLTNWSGEVRIEIREHSFNGPLRDSIGPQEARERKVLVRNEDGAYEARDADDQHLHGRDNLFASVLHALPDAERKALGYEINQGLILRQTVQKAPLSREALRPILEDNPHRKPVYDPKTMRLRGGMRGYPQLLPDLELLQRRAGSLYPAFTELQIDELLAGFGNQAEHRLSQLEAEFNNLNRAFQRWVNSPTAASRFSPEGVAQWNFRNQVYKAIRQCWQRTGPRGVEAPDIVHPQGLDLSGLNMDRHLAGMPELEANFDHVTVLIMRDAKMLDSQARFLSPFSKLRSLTLTNSRLTSFPQVISDMRFLVDLVLNGNQIRFTEVAVARLRAMTRLRSLGLSDNPLGLPPDISRMPYLQVLTLDNTGLDTWPTGLFAQPRPRSIYLNLRYNPISSIPEVAPGSFRAELLARTFVSREPEWISAANLERLKLYIESVGLDPDRPYPPRSLLDSSAWDQGMPLSEWHAKQEIWDEVEDEFGSEPFFNELRKLTESADFRASGTPYKTELTAKVWRMLEAMYQNAKLRETLFAEAFAATACADGGTQLFNAMGVEVLIHEARGLGSFDLVEKELVTLAQGKWRLNELGAIARRRVAERLAAGETFRRVDEAGVVTGTIDEVEVHLAYMTDLAERLDLPWQARGMLFRNMAGVSKAMIEAAYERVLALEQGELLAERILEQPFWETYLEEAYRPEFDSLRLRLDAEGVDEMVQFTRIKDLAKTLTRQAIERARLQRVDIPFTVKPD